MIQRKNTVFFTEIFTDKTDGVTSKTHWLGVYKIYSQKKPSRCKPNSRLKLWQQEIKAVANRTVEALDWALCANSIIKNTAKHRDFRQR